MPHVMKGNIVTRDFRKGIIQNYQRRAKANLCATRLVQSLQEVLDVHALHLIFVLLVIHAMVSHVLDVRVPLSRCLHVQKGSIATIPSVTANQSATCPGF